MRRIISIVLAMGICLGTLLIPASAISYEPNFDVVSGAVYLENLDSGTVLYEKNADEKMYPASLTKIMTAIVALENVDDLDNTTGTYTYVIQDYLYGKNASLGGLVLGEEISVRNLIASSLIQSGNESAMVLASCVGILDDPHLNVMSGITHFVEMMNEKATELGMTGTHFENPTGLHDRNHYTTAHDIAILAKYAMQNPVFAKMVGTYSMDIGPTNKHDTLWQYSTNWLLRPGSSYYYEGTLGIKTGTTDEAGHCLVSEATRYGLTYLCIVLNSPTTWKETYVNFTETRSLFNWAFNNFSLVTLQQEGELFAEVPVKYSRDGKQLKLVTKEPIEELINNQINTKNDIRYRSEVPEYVEAPIKKGDVIGTLHVILMDEELTSVDLVADSNMNLSFIRKAFGVLKQLLTSLVFRIIMAVVLVLVVLYLYFMIRYNVRKRRQKRYRQNVNRYRK